MKTRTVSQWMIILVCICWAARAAAFELFIDWFFLMSSTDHKEEHIAFTLMILLPILLGIAGIMLIMVGCLRKKSVLPYRALFKTGMVMMIPAVFIVFMILIFAGFNF